MYNLPFTPAEIETNRNGHLTGQQLADLETQLLEARQQAGDEVTQFAVVMLAIVTISFLTGLPSSWTMRLLVLAVSMFAVYEYLNSAQLRRLAADVERQQVQQLDGRVQLIERPNDRFLLTMPSANYRIYINERLFRSMQNNHTYRLYVADFSGALLSMEAVPMTGA